jgi:hypothetical protein
VPITKLKNFMDYNEDILNEAEEGDGWSEEEAPEAVPGTEETEETDLDADDWANEDEEV